MANAKCILNNLEYLALRIFLQPGRSGRFYLRQLHKYRFPLEHLKNPKSNFGAIYFAPSGRYFGRLWVDKAKCTIPFDSFSAKGKRPRGSSGGYLVYLKPVKSEWVLTKTGMGYARKAAEKLGLVLEELTDDRQDLRSKKQKLLDWWRAQPSGCTTRSQLVRQYGIITERLNPDGSAKPKTWAYDVQMRYVSMAITPIERNHGVRNLSKDGYEKRIAPHSGRPSVLCWYSAAKN